MSTFAWIVVAALVYVVAGGLVMRWDAPQALTRMRERFPDEGPAWVRSEVNAVLTGIWLCWPFCLPYLLTARRVDKVDPERLKERIAEQEKQIAELERKLL